MRAERSDILIVGGGSAGLMAGIRAREEAPSARVVCLEKANAERSGCLAMGLNSINCYLTDGDVDGYVEYVSEDNFGLIREDLVRSIGEGANRMAHRLEEMGIPFKKNGGTRPAARSKRSIEIHGERIKPVLYRKAVSLGVEILNHTPAVDLLLSSDRDRVIGASGFNIRTGETVKVLAPAVIVATGGAGGIYRPSNQGTARKVTWYPPYNAGAGLAMGARAGAEMTSFEMRFVALRTKDVIAPTGTLVLGRRVSQRNAFGVPYIEQRAAMLERRLTTPERLQVLLDEHRRGNGPCRMDFSDLTDEEYEEMKTSFLDMSPSMVLYLLDPENGRKNDVEVAGTEPYLTGGHGMAGFWVDSSRRTSLPGLYAAGDVAGGAPKKYLTGAFVEAEKAVLAALGESPGLSVEDEEGEEIDYAKNLVEVPIVSPVEFEERLQKIMEEYAGGSSSFYETNAAKLETASRLLDRLDEKASLLGASNLHSLMRLRETKDRLLLARILVRHLLERRETRWPCYQTRLDYPYRNDIEYMKFIESVVENGRIRTFSRSIAPPHEVIECR